MKVIADPHPSAAPKRYPFVTIFCSRCQQAFSGTTMETAEQAFTEHRRYELAVLEHRAEVHG